MTEYIVKFTDKSKTPITIYENSIDNSSTDLSLPGRKKLEYGRDLNANFLHILENFACPEDTTPNAPIGPDLAKASLKGDSNNKVLSNPIEGQMWYNTTQETLYVFNGFQWLPLGMSGDIAANWGVIKHGEQIPRPVNKFGYTFEYDECSWIVSPFKIEGGFRFMQCTTDTAARVTMTYTPEAPNATPVTDCATYMIVGIKGNINLGDILPIPDPTPIPSPTPTPTPSVTKSMLPSPTASVTPTPGVSATHTPPATPPNTPPPTPSMTPTTIVYKAAITANPSGLVAPGKQICYTLTLSHPAPAGGKVIRFIRSGDINNVCASTEGEINGPIIEDMDVIFSPNQTVTQICRNAPNVPPPPPTPTATPRYACKALGPKDANGYNTVLSVGFMLAEYNGGPLVYFTNASSGNGNFSPCTQWSACNDAVSYQSTQTMANNPVRNNRVYYNATPTVHLHFVIKVDGVGETRYETYYSGTVAQTKVDTVYIGSRAFTVTLNMNPVLINQSGSNKTWTVYTDYSVSDSQGGPVTAMC